MARWIPVALFGMTMAFSCTDGDEHNTQRPVSEELRTEESIERLDSTFQHCDSVYIATYHGTACCISGPTQTKPGDTVTYHYQINHKDPKMVSWEIREGDITIVEGQDKHTVTVQFGPNFTTGIIGCVGSGIKDGIRNSCSDRCVVRAPL
jgi:hypothetical protein